MLPLWLNSICPTIHAALIERPAAQQTWLNWPIAAWALDQTVLHTDADTLPQALDQLLSTKPRSAKKSFSSPVQVALLLPDNVARYEVLPWTPSLMRADEIRQFAIERFEITNQPVRNGWVVQANWTNRAAPTLAYALPHTLLDALNQVAIRHGLILSRAIPLSALAHYSRLGLVRGHELRLLHNGANTSALLYLHGQLCVHLMEVARASASDSIQRLLSRLHMSVLTPDIQLNRIAMVGVDPMALQGIISVNKPAHVQVMNPLRWEKWR